MPRVNKKAQLERRASLDNKARAEAIIPLLNELGIEASPHYHWELARYSGDIVIDPADVLKLRDIGLTLPEKQEKVR